MQIFSKNSCNIPVPLGVCVRKATMKIDDLVTRLGGTLRMRGSADAVATVRWDTRFPASEALFIVRGGAFDPVSSLAAIAEKSAAIVCVSDMTARMSAVLPRHLSLIEVIDIEAASEQAAAIFLPDATKVSLIGITGTCGKTTTASILAHILSSAGKPCGIIGTVEYAWAGKSIPSFMTTPDRWNLFSLLQMMADDGITHAVMEVSSHALALGRLQGLTLSLAIYTNLGRDHLDFHHDTASYAAAKAKIFDLLDEGKKAVINADDEACRDAVAGKGLSLVSVGLEHDADLKPKAPRIDTYGMALGIVWQGKPAVLVSSLKGVFNAYNVLCASAAALQLGVSLELLVCSLADAQAPAGRLEEVTPGVFVDYAHKPDAMENVLATLKAAGYTGIVTVFGCGGDRDRGKRPIMARVASKYSRFVVLTNDNPRTESSAQIFDDIMPGMTADHAVIEDRASAIAHALTVRREGEAVLVAGKGHEDYQIFGTKKIHFSDREAVLAYKERHV